MKIKIKKDLYVYNCENKEEFKAYFKIYNEEKFNKYFFQDNYDFALKGGLICEYKVNEGSYPSLIFEDYILPEITLEEGDEEFNEYFEIL